MFSFDVARLSGHFDSSGHVPRGNRPRGRTRPTALGVRPDVVRMG